MNGALLHSVLRFALPKTSQIGLYLALETADDGGRPFVDRAPIPGGRHACTLRPLLLQTLTPMLSVETDRLAGPGLSRAAQLPSIAASRFSPPCLLLLLRAACCLLLAAASRFSAAGCRQFKLKERAGSLPLFFLWTLLPLYRSYCPDTSCALFFARGIPNCTVTRMKIFVGYDTYKTSHTAVGQLIKPVLTSLLFFDSSLP